MPRNLLFYRTLPHFLLEGFEKYLRIEVEGVENLPKNGPAILLPNHAGFMGFDALLLSHLISKHRHKIPRILLHKFWFQTGLLKTHAKKFGFIEASFSKGLAALNKNNFVIVFPEAEAGNFKPTSERYNLQSFRRGFVRMALHTGAPVVPVLIIGAEETHINLGQIKIFNQTLPIPLNYFPLPAKWKIKFLKPIRMSAPKVVRRTPVDLDGVATDVRLQMQAALKTELSNRKFIYFDRML